MRIRFPASDWMKREHVTPTLPLKILCYNDIQGRNGPLSAFSLWCVRQGCLTQQGQNPPRKVERLKTEKEEGTFSVFSDMVELLKQSTFERS